MYVEAGRRDAATELLPRPSVGTQKRAMISAAGRCYHQNSSPSGTSEPGRGSPTRLTITWGSVGWDAGGSTDRHLPTTSCLKTRRLQGPGLNGSVEPKPAVGPPIRIDDPCSQSRRWLRRSAYAHTETDLNDQHQILKTGNG